MHEIMTPLDLLADAIKDDLTRRENSREEWIAATLDLCKHLAEARARFRDDREFSKWLEENKLGNDALNKNDRAAAIDMGKHLEDARIVLEETQRKSLQHIHDKEFAPRFPHVRKHKNPEPEKATSTESLGPKNSVASKYEQRDATIIAMRKSGVGYEEIADQFGLTPKGVSAVVVRQNMLEKGIAQAAALAVPLSSTKQEEFDRALRVALRKQEAEFEVRVQAEVKKRLDEFILPHYAAKHEQYTQVVRARKGVMTRAEFRKLQSCLHPDRITDEALKPRFAEAFNILNSCELLLCSEKEMPTGGGTLPRTVEELLARKKQRRG